MATCKFDEELKRYTVASDPKIEGYGNNDDTHQNDEYVGCK